MGSVYLADDEVLEKQVALKVLKADVAARSPTTMTQLRDEVRLAQKVTHPNVCRTYDLEEVEGRFLVKMEYVDGENLSDKIASADRISVEDALGIARAVASGLAAAHAQGVIHRDLKPQNIVIERGTGRLVLMDFGIARATEGTTVETRAVGTPDYMAPEQARAGTIDGRTDLYALGCLLYYMLVGEVPFPASTPMATVLRHLMDPIPDPRETFPDLPQWLSRVIRRLLDKEPDNRYADAAEVLRALDGPRRRNWKMIVAAGAAGVTLAAAGGVALHGYFARHEKDCAGFSIRHGVRECVVPLAADAARRRSVSWRFASERGHTVRVERRSGSGHLADDDSGLASWDYHYDERGQLKESDARDARGTLRQRLVYSDDLQRIDRRDAHDLPLPDEGTDVTVYLVEEDAHGHPARVRFANVYGSPRPDRTGAFGYAESVDARGQVIEHRSLGADGQPAPTPGGIARQLFERDAEGNVINEKLLDKADKPATGPHGWASLRRRFDERGNDVEESFFDAAGKPVLTSGGYASLHYSYDTDGARIAVACFDAANAPVLSSEGFATVRSRFDENGELAEESFQGTFGEPLLGPEGYAARRITREGAATLTSYLDMKGRPVFTRSGCAALREVRNEAARTVEKTCLGLDGQPVESRDGWAILREQSSEQGRLAEQRYLGVDAKPTLHRDGCAAWKMSYDERGRLVERACLGADGGPRAARTGEAIERMRYDEQGNRVETARFDGEGKAIVGEGGWHALTLGYDARGDVIDESHLDAARKPTHGQKGFARLHVTRDERGRVIEEERLDAAGRAVANPATWSTRTTSYDDRGRIALRKELHADGGLRSGWRARYDEAGHLVEESFLDGSGGVSRMLRAELDARGHRVMERELDGEGRPRLTADGWASKKTTYDLWGRPTDVNYLDINDKPLVIHEGVAGARTRYDDQGRAVQLSYVGLDGKPAASTTGVATTVTTFDRFSRRVEERTFGLDGKPVAPAGIAGRAFLYDSDGEVHRVIDFDLDGQAISGIGNDGAVSSGRRFWWTAEGAHLHIRGAAQEARALELTRAFRSGWASERLRAASPALFHGARGVLVTRDAPPLAAGDVLLVADGRPLERPEDLLPSSKPVALTLLREGKDLELSAPILPDLALAPQ